VQRGSRDSGFSPGRRPILCPDLLGAEDRRRTRSLCGAAAGVGSAPYLIWVELFRVDAICLWCTAVHACALLLLALVLWTVSGSVTGP